MLYLQDLLDDEKVYEKVRELRWGDGKVRCPHCGSEDVVKKGLGLVGLSGSAAKVVIRLPAELFSSTGRN